MTLEAGPDGTFRIQLARGVYLVEVGKGLWDRVVARTYSNDTLCPRCEQHGGQYSVRKGQSYVYYNDSANRVTRLYCTGCTMQVVRVKVEEKNRFFGLGVEGLA